MKSRKYYMLPVTSTLKLTQRILLDLKKYSAGIYLWPCMYACCKMVYRVFYIAFLARLEFPRGLPPKKNDLCYMYICISCSNQLFNIILNF